MAVLRNPSADLCVAARLCRGLLPLVALMWWPVLGTPPLLASTPAADLIPADRLRDLQLAVAGRRLLLADPDLAGLNLGLSVRQGMASVWGPVNNAYQAVRATEVLSTLPGLDGVRDELYLGTSPNPLLVPLPTRDRATLLPERVPARPEALTGRVLPAAPAPVLPSHLPSPRNPRPPVELLPPRPLSGPGATLLPIEPDAPLPPR